MKGRPYSFRTNYSVNSQAFVLEATLTISSEKLPRRLNLLNGSQLYHKTIKCKKILSFVQLQSNPAVASPREQLYEQMTSNPAFTERNLQKSNAYLRESRPEQNLWSRITLYRACTYVFGLSTL